jgi:hypothetical protein
MGLSVPVRVLGHDPDGTGWEEMTATDDASYGGASFPLKHPHGVGQVLSLSLPLPRNFRRYDLTETSYKIFALVRNTRAGAEGERVAGVMFIGKVPPRGYDQKPGGRYRLPDDPRTGTTPGAERRQHERLQLFVNLRVRRLGVSGTLEEQTVTENVSRGGARVFTTLPVSSGETLTVADPPTRRGRGLRLQRLRGSRRRTGSTCGSRGQLRACSRRRGPAPPPGRVVTGSVPGLCRPRSRAATRRCGGRVAWGLRPRARAGGGSGGSPPDSQATSPDCSLRAVSRRPPCSRTSKPSPGRWRRARATASAGREEEIMLNEYTRLARPFFVMLAIVAVSG